MRMWMVNPKIMCTRHLCGEHNELHKFLGGMRLGRSMNGYIEKEEIEPQSWFERHEELVKEMLLRWPKNNGHASLLDKAEVESLLIKTFSPQQMRFKIDKLKSCLLLMERCEECRERTFENV